MKAVIIEQDYKGNYSRYALTLEEFETEYRKPDPDIPVPTEEGDSYTCRLFVHIWFKLVEIGSDEWNKFFTNMLLGLPESDIENDNKAYVAPWECFSLRPLVEKYIQKE